MSFADEDEAMEGEDDAMELELQTTEGQGGEEDEHEAESLPALVRDHERLARHGVPALRARLAEALATVDALAVPLQRALDTRRDPPDRFELREHVDRFLAAHAPFRALAADLERAVAHADANLQLTLDQTLLRALHGAHLAVHGGELVPALDARNPALPGAAAIASPPNPVALMPRTMFTA